MKSSLKQSEGSLTNNTDDRGSRAKGLKVHVKEEPMMNIHEVRDKMAYNMASSDSINNHGAEAFLANRTGGAKNP